MLIATQEQQSVTQTSVRIFSTDQSTTTQTYDVHTTKKKKSLIGAKTAFPTPARENKLNRVAKEDFYNAKHLMPLSAH